MWTSMRQWLEKVNTQSWDSIELRCWERLHLSVTTCFRIFTDFCNIWHFCKYNCLERHKDIQELAVNCVGFRNYISSCLTKCRQSMFQYYSTTFCRNRCYCLCMFLRSSYCWCTFHMTHKVSWCRNIFPFCAHTIGLRIIITVTWYIITIVVGFWDTNIFCAVIRAA